MVIPSHLSRERNLRLGLNGILGPASGFINALFNTPGFPKQEYYFSIGLIMTNLRPILSNRLLINIRKAGMSNKDWQAVSTLVFARNLTRVPQDTESSCRSSDAILAASNDFTTEGEEGYSITRGDVEVEGDRKVLA